MKKLLLSLIGGVAVVSQAFAGTVYERTTLENVVNGEPFAMFSTGTIASTKFNYTPYLCWASSYNAGNGNGTMGYVNAPGMVTVPDNFDRSIVGSVNGGYNNLPALFTLEDAGTGTADNAERQFYYIKGRIQKNINDDPIYRYIGIDGVTTGHISGSNTEPTGTGYKMYFEPATCSWTDYYTNENVTYDNCYKISSARTTNRAFIFVIHDNNGGSLSANSTAITANMDWTGAASSGTNKRFPVIFRAIQTEEQICGIGNQTEYSVSLGLTQSMAAPALVLKTVKENGAAVTPYVVNGPVTYKYVVEEGVDVLSIADDGTFTGIGEGTARVKVTLSDISACHYDAAEPFYINVDVKDGFFVTYDKVNAIAELQSLAIPANESLILVSSKPLPSLGYVAARYAIENNTTTNMLSLPILGGAADLPVDFSLPILQANDLQVVRLKPNGSGMYALQVLRGPCCYTDGRLTYVYRGVDDKISYNNKDNYMTVEAPEGENGFTWKYSTSYLGFKSNGVMTYHNNQTINVNGACPAVYTIRKADADIVTGGMVILDEGQTALTAALLKAAKVSGDSATVEGAKLVYEVVDANGNVLAEEDAPISVAADGTITALKPGQARVKVTAHEDYGVYFNAEPAYCDVIVRTPAYVFINDKCDEDMAIDLKSGEEVTLPAASLRISTTATEDLPNAAFSYVFADETNNWAPMLDEEGNYVTANDWLSVDPATGVVTTTRGKVGTVYIVPVMTAETEKYYYLAGDAQHLLYGLNVTAVPSTIVIDTPASTLIPEGAEGQKVPTPVLRDAEGNAIEGVTFTYEVINPATGEPYAPGEAPIAIDTEGNIIVLGPGKATIRVKLTDDLAEGFEADAFDYDVTVTKQAQVAVGDDDADTTVDVANGAGATATLPAPVLRDSEGNAVEGAAFTFVLCGEDGTPLLDSEGNPLTENESVIINPATGEVTVKDGAQAGTVYVAAVLTGDAAAEYHTDGNFVYTVNVAEPVYETLLRVNSREELNVVGMEGVYLVSARQIGDLGYVGAEKKDLTGVTNTTFAPVKLGVAELPAELTLNSTVAEKLMPFDIYLAYDVDSKVNEKNGYRVMVPDGRYVYRTYYTQNIDLTDRAGIDAANGGNGFWYPITVTNGNFQIKTGGNYLGFDETGTLKHVGASIANVAIYAPYVAATISAGDAAAKPAELFPGQTAKVPAPAVTTQGEDGRTLTGVTYVYTVVDENGNPIADAPVTVDAEGNITAVAAGQARIMVTIAEPYAKFFDAEPMYYDVTVSAPLEGFYVTYDKLNTVDELQPLAASGKETIILVSSKQLPDLGYVAARHEVTTYTNMTSLPILEGAEVLPAEFTLPMSQADELQAIRLKPNGSGMYAFHVLRGSCCFADGRPTYLYFGGTVNKLSYNDKNNYMTVDAPEGENGFTWNYSSSKGGGFLGFKTDGVLTYHNNQVINVTGACPALYTIRRAKATITVEPELTIHEGHSATLTPELKAVNADGNEVAVEAIEYAYEVVDANGNAFAEGKAPVTVDAATGNVTAFTYGDAIIRVTVAPQSEIYFDLEPATVKVNVPETARIEFSNGSTTDAISIPQGQTGNSVPTPALVDSNDNPVEGVSFKYEVIDPATGEPFAEGEAPITVDENGNITTVEGKTGDARIVVTLSDESGDDYKADPAYYDVKVTVPTVISGVNGENDINLQIGEGKSTDLPAIKLETIDKDGNTVEVEGAVFTYEVIDPATGEPFAEGEAPVTVDPETGKVTAVEGKSGDAVIKATLTAPEGYNADPFLIDVTVKDYNYVRLQKVVDPTTIKAGDPVVFVSSTPINGLGYVAPSSDNVASGIETGTTGNMPPVAVLPGASELPAELLLTTEQAEAVRMFSIVTNDETSYGFRILNGVKFGTGQYLRSEKNDRLRYLDAETLPYSMEAKQEGVYAPQSGSFYLSFNRSGILTSFPTSNNNANGAAIVFYSVVRQKATLEFEGGTTGDGASINLGVIGNRVPTPSLVITDENGEDEVGVGDVIEGATFKYEVIDPETGLPFAEGEAPIIVDENGNITTVKDGDAIIRVTLSDESGRTYEADPIDYRVTVNDARTITGANGETDIVLPMGLEDEITIPTPKLTIVDENGNEVEVGGITYNYEVIDPATGEPYAEGEAPVIVDEEGNVTSTAKEGDAIIRVTAPAPYQDVKPFDIKVSVKDYDFVTYVQVTDLAEITSTDNLIFVSSKAVSGKGFVASSHLTEVEGINTGTTGNMAPVAILPGANELPAEMRLHTEKADMLRKFNIIDHNGTGLYGFYITDWDAHIKAERNDRIRYHATQYTAYAMNRATAPAAAPRRAVARAAVATAWVPTSGNLTLGYNESGILTHGSTDNNIVIYKVQKPKYTIVDKNGLSEISFSGDNNEETLTPQLVDDNGNEIEGVTFKYEVNVTPVAAAFIRAAAADSNDAASAPIAVDPETGKVTVLKGDAAEGTVKVSLSDESAKQYDADPLVYAVSVADGTTTGIDEIMADDVDANDIYFNLQGVRVYNPGAGMYLRLRGTQVDKVIVK